MAQNIARMYQQCDPAKPLEPGDARYVPCENARGEGELIAQLTNSIRWSETPVHLLFAGHRGGGKSTELLRLQHELINPPENEGKFFVVYFEADKEDVDVNDVDFPDLLFAIIRQVGAAFRKELGEELRSSWLSKFVDSLKRFLGTEVEFEQLELDAKIAKFTATIKNSPDARDQIRKALEPNVSNLIQAANELLNEAIITLRVKQYRDLVIIVDNLDRIVLRDLENGMTTHDRLFLNRGAQLHALNCHVVYTLPISMVFSPNATALAAIFSRRPGHDHPFGQKNLDYASQAPLHPGYTGFGPNDDHGRRPDVLPMVKVINVDGTDSLAGMNAMCDIVRRRLAGANVEEQEAFDSTDTLKYLCRMSGGHIRNLLILIRSSCTTAGKLPLTHAIVEQAIRSIRNDFKRALNRPVFFEILREVYRLKALPGSEHDQLLLYNFSVLEYLNGDVWYAVNPAVRELDKFNPPSNE